MPTCLIGFDGEPLPIFWVVLSLFMKLKSRQAENGSPNASIPYPY